MRINGKKPNSKVIDTRSNADILLQTVVIFNEGGIFITLDPLPIASDHSEASGNAAPCFNAASPKASE